MGQASHDASKKGAADVPAAGEAGEVICHEKPINCESLPVHTPSTTNRHNNTFFPGLCLLSSKQARSYLSSTLLLLFPKTGLAARSAMNKATKPTAPLVLHHAPSWVLSGMYSTPATPSHYKRALLDFA